MVFIARMLPHCRWPDNPILLGGSDLNGTVFLSEALQRNAKHEARLSNISDLFPLGWIQKWSEILRFTQNDISRWLVDRDFSK